MNNRIGYNRLNRKSSHRKALHRNMVTSLMKHERIKTTQAKAKAIRRKAEKLITRAKVDSVHNRRIVAEFIYEKFVVNKMFTELGPRYEKRPGGYTRIMKLGQRFGDAAEMVLLEFVQEESPQSKSSKSGSGKKKSNSQVPSKKTAQSGQQKKIASTSTEDIQATQEVKEPKEVKEVKESGPSETEASMDSASDNSIAEGEDSEDNAKE